MSYLKSLLGVFANGVDTAVPAAVGNRTQIVTLLCTALHYGGPFVPPQYQPAVALVQGILCGSAPVFALANVARSVSASTPAK